jgi:hypothetical protein
MPLSARELVARLGPHPATRAGIDPGADADSARWLMLALLLAARLDEDRAVAISNALVLARAPHDVASFARVDIASLAALLAREHVPRPESIAATALRACRALVHDWQGSIERLVVACDDLDVLGTQLCALAPGIGHATALRLLRPLRDRFDVAREVPLAAPARTAAIHLGWLSDRDDAEGEPASLRARVASEPDAPRFADVEGALERLGAAACQRERIARCPLGVDCPKASA